MKIAMKAIGAERWIAGVYYISNLVKALKSLPANETPDLLLVRTLESEVGLYGEIEGLVDIYPRREFSAQAVKLSGLRKMARQLMDRHAVLFSMARWMLSHVNSRRYMALLETMKGEGVDLLFPCQVSMGSQAPVSWLPWVWDLQHKHYPDLFSRSERRRRDRTFSDIARDASLVVVSSHDAKNDVSHYYPECASRLRVLQFHTYPEASWYTGDAALVCRKYSLPDRFLMLPNQFFAHKNHRTAFEAIRILSSRLGDASLVCTGNTRDWRRPGYFAELQSFIRDHGLAGRIRILGLIPRDDQMQIMSRALAVLQPSLFEGWSTVVEDARAMGRPLYVSDIPVHREQAHPLARYFDPQSSEMLADILERDWAELLAAATHDSIANTRSDQMNLIAEYGRAFLGIANELLQLKTRP